MTLSDPSLAPHEEGFSFIVWALRSIGRRECRRGADARRLLEPGRPRWQTFAGGAGRLHAGDLVRLALENAAAVNSLGFQLRSPLDGLAGEQALAAAFDDEKLLAAPVAEYLEQLAVAFGRPPLGSARRAAFGPIRADQRILELPSTAARVAASVAPKDAPLETYVSYVVADDIDRFIVGCAMAEFDRTQKPALIEVDTLSRGDRTAVSAAFTKVATLISDDPLLALLPPAAVGDRVVVL